MSLLLGGRSGCFHVILGARLCSGAPLGCLPEWAAGPQGARLDVAVADIVTLAHVALGRVREPAVPRKMGRKTQRIQSLSNKALCRDVSAQDQVQGGWAGPGLLEGQGSWAQGAVWGQDEFS